VEGDQCYHDLGSIPGGVQAVVIGTSPEHAEETMHDCADLAIKHVWMHRGPGGGSVSETATAYGREHGITVIDGGCPWHVRAYLRSRSQGHARRADHQRQRPKTGSKSCLDGSGRSRSGSTGARSARAEGQ
jgi:hypothetical protein